MTDKDSYYGFLLKHKKISLLDLVYDVNVQIAFLNTFSKSMSHLEGFWLIN